MTTGAWVSKCRPDAVRVWGEERVREAFNAPRVKLSLERREHLFRALGNGADLEAVRLWGKYWLRPHERNALIRLVAGDVLETQRKER